jgi:hypothetical protein
MGLIQQLLDRFHTIVSANHLPDFDSHLNIAWSISVGICH